MEKNCEDCVHAMRTVDDFPCCDCHRYERFEDANGIPQPSKTLLDEFAMAAMQGLVASAFKHLSEEKASGPVTEGAMAIMKDVGATAYLIAAAMMKERARRDEMGNVKEVE